MRHGGSIFHSERSPNSWLSRISDSSFLPPLLRLGFLSACLACFFLLGSLTTARAQQPSDDQATEPSSLGSIGGKIVDRNGNVVVGAHVSLLRDEQILTKSADTDEDGAFSFDRVPPGPFQLKIEAEGFASQTVSGARSAGQNYTVPQITLSLATELTEVRVSLSTVEIAQEQIKAQEQQRVFGVIPNFYVSYAAHPVPLTSKQKFQLAWKTTMDPVSFAAVGVIAGIDQAANRFPGYGQGAEGYAKRYGASYGNFLSGIYIGAAILPSILKQDPRYFYKGTGTKRSRFLYAVANAVICKGDNQQWQPNYSEILGNLAAGGISNLYYPPEDRHGAALTFENAAIGIASSAAINVLEEFVLRKVTPKLP